MRTFVVATATAAVVALAGGCSGSVVGSGEQQESDDPPSATTAPDDTAVPVVDSEACEEVRTGIDAFNEGDYEGTVTHFEAAVPLAEDRDDGTQAAGDLVDAIHYYAELAPADYPEAARSSPQFARYKAITLGQCMPVGSEPESPGTDI